MITSAVQKTKKTGPNDYSIAIRDITVKRKKKHRQQQERSEKEKK